MADRLSVLYAAIFVSIISAAVVATDGLALSTNAVVGGDFLAFYTAGEFALSGDALSAYNFTEFDARLREHSGLNVLGMMWQYPPTVFFLTAPLALAPYKISYVLWVLAGWLTFAQTLRYLGLRGATLRILICSPLCVAFLTYGQLNFLTSSLLLLASFEPRQRWLVAGVAAGLLTIKPQLGLLLPFAFLAVGAWRTIAVAALTTVILHAPSLFVYGFEGWSYFISAVGRLNADITTSATLTPPQGMTTLFGQLKMLGLNGVTAINIQYVATACMAVLVALVWRRPFSAVGKSAFLIAAAMLAAPYAYGYEMTALLFAAVYLAKTGSSYKSPYGLFLLIGWVLIATSMILPVPAPLNIHFALSVATIIFVVLALRSETSNKTSVKRDTLLTPLVAPQPSHR